MKKFVWLFPALVLLFALAACAPVEKGTITFTTQSITLNDDTGIVQVVINNSFVDDKLASIAVDGVQVGFCGLVRNSTSTCTSIQLSKVGTHTVTATVTKNNGDPVTAQMAVNWSPYTKLDKLAQSLAGGEGKDPAMGYAFGAIILIVGLTITMTALTNGSPVGAAFGFFISIIIVMLVLFQAESTGAALVVFNGMIGLAVFGVIATIIFVAIKNGYTVTSPKADISLFYPDGRIEKGSFAQPFLGPGSNAPSFTEATRVFAERNTPRLPDSQRDTNLLDDGY